MASGLMSAGDTVVKFARELGEAHGFYKAQDKALAIVTKAIGAATSVEELEHLSAMYTEIANLKPEGQDGPST